jgi:hypothetical protein
VIKGVLVIFYYGLGPNIFICLRSGTSFSSQYLPVIGLFGVITL